jgi:hypothetical protein
MAVTTVNVNPARVAVPPGVTILTLPVAPAPTTAVMLVAELTVKEVAAVPPKLTAVAPVKLVPVTVTEVAVPPLVGVKEVMVGAGIKVKPASVAVPPGVVTFKSPEEPVPTIAVILVAELTVKEVAATPPKLTAVVPVKLVPVTVTDVAVPPVVGVKEMIVGAGINVKPAKVAVPPAVVTLTVPEAPVPTTAVMLVAELTVNEVAALPPNLTAVAPVKLLPVIVIDAPVIPLVGPKEVMVGAGININPARVAVPPDVVTLTFPEVPAPTTAVILVAELTVNEVAAVPPKLTAVAPAKFVPVIVIEAPLLALVGVKEVMIGAGINVNPAIVAVPPALVTATLPDAPAPTVAVMFVGELTVNDDAGIPPKLTATASVKLVPLIVINEPIAPLEGVNEVMVGIVMLVKVNPAAVAVPPTVVTLTLPEAPAPTVAEILVEELILNEEAEILPKLTLLVVNKLVPVILIDDPVPPLVGVNETIVGCG